MNSSISLIKALVCSRPRSYRRSGQTLALMVIALPAFIGAMGLAMDVGNLYWNHRKLQVADDASVLAGAFCLPDPSLCSPVATASGYATGSAALGLAGNSIAPSEIVAGPTVGTWTDGLPDITMTLRRNVSFTFARLVGIDSAPVQVKATAEVGVPNEVFDGFPIGLQCCAGQDGCPSSGASGTICPYGVGASPTPLTFASNDGTTGISWSDAPGNWSPVDAGTGGTSVDIPLCPTGTGCINASPGFGKSGAAGVGLGIQSLICDAQAMIDAAAPGTLAHIVVPVVNWTTCSGGHCPLNVYDFAEIALLSTSATTTPRGGCTAKDPKASYITGEFVKYVNPGKLGPPGTNSIGAMTEQLVE